MANMDQYEIIDKGVKEWNEWRMKFREVKPDLSYACFVYRNLSGVDFSNTDLSHTNLNYTVLTRARFDYAKLKKTYFKGANLTNASFMGAELYGTIFNNTSFHKAFMGLTEIDNVDLRSVKELDTVIHHFRSTIDIDTIYRSNGIISNEFLRGAGIPNDMIELIKKISEKPLKYHSCFICHSSKDKKFVEQLCRDLQNNDVRYWFAPEDMKIGDKIRDRLHQEIRQSNRLLIILSENSIGSQWVEDEVEFALEKERKTKKSFLFPLMLDNAIFESEKGWAESIKNIRHIGDFREWENPDKYKKAFDKLLLDLKAEEKKN